MFLGRLSTLRSGLEEQLRKAVETVEGVVKTGFDEQESAKVAAYKELYVEMQLEQLRLVRQYQTFVAQAEPAQDDGAQAEPAQAEPAQAEPARDDAWVAEWEERMKANMRERLEALAEAREQQETSQALSRQLEMLKEHVRRQDERMEHLEKLEEYQAKKEVDQETAIDGLACEYSKLSGEAEATRQRLADAEREVQRLRDENARQNQSMELLLASPAAERGSEPQGREVEGLSARVALLERDLEKERQRCATLAEEAASRQAELAKIGAAEAGSGDTAEVDRLEEALRQSESARRLLEAQLEARGASRGAEADARGEMTALQARVEELEASLAASNAKEQQVRSTLEQQLAAHAATSDELKGELEQRVAEVAQLEAARAAAVAQAEGAQAELKQELAAARSANAALERELEASAEGKAALEAEQAKARDSHSAAMAQAAEELRAAREQAEAAASAAAVELADAQAEASRIKARVAELEKTAKEDAAAAKAAAEALREEHKVAMEAAVSEREQEAADKREALEKLRAAESERDDAFVVISEERAQREAALKALRAEMEARVDKAIAMTRDRMQGKVDEYKKLYVKESALRKRVHNELMDLKGNIRVFCRVRPVLANERKANGEDAVDVTEFPVANEIAIAKDEASRSRFEFDHVFAPDATQRQVFEDISPLVTSVLDGYNVCIFAYGQTGSGKTHTMEGTRADPGVNFRALAALFEIRDDRISDEEFRFTVSVLEIYNETVRDLLCAEDTRLHAPSRANLEIRLNTEGKVFVKGLEEQPVSSMADVQAAMRTAQGNRAVGAHNMNEHSSRSHLVLTVNISSHNKISGAKSSGRLNLIDLAGSERVGKTDASGSRLKEAQNINKSLSALGDVIQALGSKSSKQGHVPYRNSKLTHLLQNSLGGDSKVAMFVNISPIRWNAAESVCSLNFASRCRKVQLGAAKKNGSAELAKYKRMVDDLQAQLASHSRTYDGAAATPRRPRR